MDFDSLGYALSWNTHALRFRIHVRANLEYRGLRPDISYLMRFGCASLGYRSIRRSRCNLICFGILEWPANE